MAPFPADENAIPGLVLDTDQSPVETLDLNESTPAASEQPLPTAPAVPASPLRPDGLDQMIVDHYVELIERRPDWAEKTAPLFAKPATTTKVVDEAAAGFFNHVRAAFIACGYVKEDKAYWQRAGKGVLLLAALGTLVAATIAEAGHVGLSHTRLLDWALVPFRGPITYPASFGSLLGLSWSPFHHVASIAVVMIVGGTVSILLALLREQVKGKKLELVQSMNMPWRQPRWILLIFPLMMLFEEGVFRYAWLSPVMVLCDWTWLRSFACCTGILAFIGLHLFNYAKGSRRPDSIIHYLPTAFSITWVFLSYGFVAALLAHTLFDLALLVGAELEALVKKLLDSGEDIEFDEQRIRALAQVLPDERFGAGLADDFDEND